MKEPYMLLSGYRSPATNAMLRSKSRGVAKNSLHMKGMAADLRLKSRSVSQMARAAEACSAGGVGQLSAGRISSTWIAARSAAGAAETVVPISLTQDGAFRGAFLFPDSQQSWRDQFGMAFGPLTSDPSMVAPPRPRHLPVRGPSAREIPAPPRIFPNCRPGWPAV